MKRKIKIVLLIIGLLFITACDNPIDNFVKDVKKEINSGIKNTSEDKIKESINYISKHYDKKINKKFVYHTLLLNKLCDNSYLEDTNIGRLADASYEYMFRQSKGNKKELEESIEIVNENLDQEVTDFYNYYQRSVMVSAYLATAKTKLLVEVDENNFINSNKINKAIDYINNYYDNSFKNNEITDSICYYSMYLEKIGSKNKKNNNNIVKLGISMKKYLQEGKESQLIEVKKLIDEVSNNKEALIGELVSSN